MGKVGMQASEGLELTGMGGLASSCANFIRMVESALAELQDELRDYNRAERNRFNRSQQRNLK